MAKFYGEIGYGITAETAPGVHELQITPRNYYGELVKNSRRMQSSESVNDNINTSLEISILSDTFANDNFQSMLYVVFRGTKWKITNVDYQFPRLILTIGGVYNG